MTQYNMYVFKNPGMRRMMRTKLNSWGIEKM